MVSRQRAHPVRRNDNTPVLIAVAVSILALAAFFVMRTGAPDPPAAPEPPPVAAKPVDPHAARRDAARDWFGRSFYDAMGKAKDLGGDEVRALFAEADRLGHANVPGLDWTEKKREVYKRLLARVPDDPDANRAFGRTPLSDFPEFFAVFRRLVDAKALPDEFHAFRRQYEDKVRYVPERRAPALEPAEFERARDILQRYVAFEKRLAENPTERAIFENLKRIQIDPILGDYETVRLEEPPYVLFYASKDLKPKDASDGEQRRVRDVQERLRGRLEGFRGLIRAYLAFFRERTMEPLKLEPIAPTQLFFIWVFEDKKSWEEYGQRMGTPPPPGLLGYFNPRDHWVFLFEDRDNAIGTTVSLAHEMTHQLHWHFSKVGEDVIANRMQATRAVWFSEGWAEYVSWHTHKDGVYTFAQDAPERMNVFHLCRKMKLPVYPLRLVVQHASYGDWLSHTLRTWLPRVMKDALKGKELNYDVLAPIYLEMLYAEGWLFVKFLNEFMDGKYKARLLRYTELTLKGFGKMRGAQGYAQPHEVFAQVMGLSGDADWATLQREFDDYLEAMTYKIPSTLK